MTKSRDALRGLALAVGPGPIRAAATRGRARRLLALACLAAMAGSPKAANYTFSAGVWAGPVLGAGDVLSILPGSTKQINGGSPSLINAGLVNASDDLFFYNGGAASNSGVYSFLADVGLRNLAFGGSFANSGILRKSGGTGSSTTNGIGFSNSGTIDAQTGTILFQGGNLSFLDSSNFSGAGSVKVTVDASWAGTQNVSGNLTLAGGTQTGSAVKLNGIVNWTDGNLAGDWRVNSGQTLKVQGGSTKQVANAGTKLTNLGMIAATDQFYFYNGAAVDNQAVYDLQGDFGIHNGAYGGSFSNSGTLRKSAGTLDSTVDGISFSNSGNIDVQTGRLLFQGGSLSFAGGSSFSGAGQTVVTADASWSGSQNVTGQLTLAGGTQTGSGAQVTGVVNWTKGNLKGGWQVNAGQTLNLQTGGSKIVHDAGTLLLNQGTVNAGDDLSFYNNAVLTNQGLYKLQGDVGLHNAAFGGSFNNQASGVFSKTAGSGNSAIDGITFNNSGTIDAQTGTILFQGGTFNFNGGGTFSAAGQVVVGSSAAWAGTQNIQGSLSLTGGTQSGSAVLLNGNVNWSGGNLTGSWQVNNGKTLNLQGGSQKVIYNAGTVLTNLGTIAAIDDLFFYNGGVLTNQGLYALQGDVGLHDVAYGGTFNNPDGAVLRKTAGTGSSAIDGITFNNSGAIDVQTGTLLFQGGTLNFNNGSNYSGNGQVRVTASANWAGIQNVSTTLTLAGGIQTGSNVQLNGPVNWSDGNLVGGWQVDSGKTLNLQAGTTKTVVNPGTVLTIQGTVAATDDLFFYNGAAVANQGLYSLQGDIGLRDGGYSGQFTNNATLRKTAGNANSRIAGLSFNNTGTIEAQTGTILFQGGELNFGDGSIFSGAGQVEVASSATWTGTQNVTGNLSLTGGVHNSGGTTGALLNGPVNWIGGNLVGHWQVNSGATLNLRAGNTKALTNPGTVLTNQGVVVATSDLSFYNGAAVVNQGVYKLQADVGLLDGGYGGHFDNQGLLVKTAGGSGTSSVSGIDFTNSGTVSVLSGTIALPSNFVNVGTLTGTGQFALSGTLSNNGHLAPGAAGGAPATLTIGHTLALGSTSSLDLDLQSLSSHDLLAVSGNVAPAGLLALSCYASCHFSVGDMILVLDSTGTLTNSSFAGLTMSGFATGAFNIVYDRAQGDVWLQATQDVTAAVPEPATYGLMLSGMALSAGLVRRRRG